MSAYRLPVSGLSVILRDPDGHDEALLAQRPEIGLAFKLDVLARLALPEDTVRWAELPAADLDPAFLAIRQRLVGDRLVAEVNCAICGGKGDLTFSVSSYLAAHAPVVPRGITVLPDGWFGCAGARFRLPTANDLLAAAEEQPNETRAAAALDRHSIRAESARGRRRARRALEQMAPLITAPVMGACPECRAVINAWFDPAGFVLAELAQRAAAVFEQVHLIASRYGWSEGAILDLPGWRRARYAALIAADAGTLRAAARAAL